MVLSEKVSLPMGKLVDLSPTNTDERTILGVYYFNGSDIPNAQKQWDEVVKQDPKKAEAYFDLGYLYLIKEPPDNDKAIAAWQKVLEIDPQSDMAKTVSEHISALSTASPSPATPAATPTK